MAEWGAELADAELAAITAELLAAHERLAQWPTAALAVWRLVAELADEAARRIALR